MNSTFELTSEQGSATLSRADLAADPISQFGEWFNKAIAVGVPEPNAMTLATSTLQGMPSARVVLLKGFDERGFVFYTNYESRKGLELAQNPHVALVFFWPGLDRQIRVEGIAAQVSRAESNAYFHSRSIGSQIGAWASQQSQVIRSRAELEGRLQELLQRYANQVVPLPPYWGGFRVRPMSVEFWQGRPNRLHDRFVYRRASEQNWKIDRLSP